MKAAAVSAVALASFSSFPSIAQQQPTQPQQEPQVQQPSPAPPTGQSQPGAPSAASANAADLKSVSGELVDKLDTKSAKQGDSVVVKTSEDLKVSGGTDIPKGSKLMGHVTNVQARGEGKENSQIAIQFDKAELKGGQTVAIESIIQSVSPAAGIGVDNSVPNAPTALGASPASPGTPSGTSPSSPSMNGATTPNGSTSMNGGSANTSSNRPGEESNGTAQPGQADQTANGGMPAPGTIVARNGNVAIRTTAIPGVLLANALNGQPFANASGLLVGARRDIHLDEGTRMVVAVAGTPQGPGGMSR